MTIYTGAGITSEGLVMYLDTTNTKSYPGSGTAMYDISGSNYHHTLFGGAVYTTMDGIPCINTAVEGRYLADAGTTYTFGAAHTMIAWARPLADSQVATWRTLWRTQPNDHPLLISNDQNLIGYYDNDAAGFQSYGINLGTIGMENRWTMFTLVASGGSTTLYINDLAYSGTVAYSASGMAHDALGAAAGSQAFGYIGSALLYNRAITQAEILRIYNAMNRRFGI